MQEGELLRSQRNEVFGMIRGTKLNAGDFVWVEDDSAHLPVRISVLRHRGTAYFFRFDLKGPGAHWARFAPGDRAPVQEADSRSWSAQLQWLRAWLDFLEREVISPDLWQGIVEGREFLEATVGNGLSNRPFSAVELGRVQLSCIEVRDMIAGAGALDEQRDLVLTSRIDYLREAATRLGRKDWVLLSAGLLLDLVLELDLTREEAQEVIRFAPLSLAWLRENSP